MLFMYIRKRSGLEWRHLSPQCDRICDYLFWQQASNSRPVGIVVETSTPLATESRRTTLGSVFGRTTHNFHQPNCLLLDYARPGQVVRPISSYDWIATLLIIRIDGRSTHYLSLGKSTSFNIVSRTHEKHRINHVFVASSRRYYKAVVLCHWHTDIYSACCVVCHCSGARGIRMENEAL